MKMKKFWAGGGARPSCPTLDPPLHPEEFQFLIQVKGIKWTCIIRGNFLLCHLYIHHAQVCDGNVLVLLYLLQNPKRDDHSSVEVRVLCQGGGQRGSMRMRNYDVISS